MTAIFVSDVHLRDATSVKSKLFIRFLQEKASQFEKIYILGDLFDVWPGTTEFLIRTFQPITQELKNLVLDGHEMHYVEGNHDFRLGNYFTDDLGIQVHTDTHTETWNGKNVYMAHGDLGNPKDLGYRCLRYLLRRDVVHTAARAIPQDWIFKIGAKSSQLSRNYQIKKPIRNDAQVRQIYRQTAESIFAEGYDVVLMGHTHLPDDMSTLVGNRPCRYINLGDWVSHFTYLEFDGTQFYTKTHPLKTL
jgi:UDP-2,3-diacylglucosamine hydrolase